MARVLSFSGGGVRGYLSILMFEEYCRDLYHRATGRDPSTKELDEFVDKTVLPSFLLIAGTSVGGITALLLSIGVPLSIVKTTLANPSRMFSKNSWIKPSHWLSSKYNPSGLMSLYVDVLAGGNPDGVCKYQDYLRDHGKTIKAVDLQLCHLKRVCAVTTYDLNSSNSLLLSSHKQGKYAQVRLMDAFLSTCAAPNYFPIHEFEYEGDELKCVDGSVWANDSSFVSLFLAQRKNNGGDDNGLDPDTKYSVFCFGTGYFSKKKWMMMAQNAIGWAIPVNSEIPLLALFDSSTAAARQFMQLFEEMGVVNYYPFDIELKNTKLELDDVNSIPAQEQLFQKALREPCKFRSTLTRALREPLYPPPSIPRTASSSQPLDRMNSKSSSMSFTSSSSQNSMNSKSSLMSFTSSSSSLLSSIPNTRKRAVLQPINSNSILSTGNPRTLKSFTLKIPSSKRQKGHEVLKMVN